MNTSEMTDTVENLQDQAKHLRDRATEEANRWKERAVDSAKHASEATDRFVHENVWTTITIAALAGCAVGFLLARGHD